jgi:hypothetical protein
MAEALLYITARVCGAEAAAAAAAGQIISTDKSDRYYTDPRNRNHRMQKTSAALRQWRQQLR